MLCICTHVLLVSVVEAVTIYVTGQRQRVLVFWHGHGRSSVDIGVTAFWYGIMYNYCYRVMKSAP